MKKVILSTILISASLAFICCNRPKPESTPPTKPVDSTAFKYNIDSASQEVAMLVFNENGEPEYIVGIPDKIFRSTKSGLEYRFISNGTGKIYPKVGDVIYINMNYKTESDSILFKSREVDKDFKMRLEVPSHKGGCVEEAFMMMNEGDSAIFKIDAVNFFKYTQGKVNIPRNIKSGDKLVFNIKMEQIVSGSEYVKQNSEMIGYYINQENSMIERYLLSFDYAAVKKESGLRVMTIKKGTGKKVAKGNAVTINYTAGFIDGSIFDSTIERNKPFRFVMGKNEVIEGLEEGVSEMNVGDHCIFIIPFRLAYGETKQGIIPPYSTLVFEVDLINAQ